MIPAIDMGVKDLPTSLEMALQVFRKNLSQDGLTRSDWACYHCFAADRWVCDL